MATVMETLEMTKTDGLCSDIAVPDTVLEAVSGKGYEWHVWTVDDVDTAKRMIERGTGSVITNVPELIINEVL